MGPSAQNTDMEKFLPQFGRLIVYIYIIQFPGCCGFYKDFNFKVMMAARFFKFE
jgi:hypothetical protein